MDVGLKTSDVASPLAHTKTALIHVRSEHAATHFSLWLWGVRLMLAFETSGSHEMSSVRLVVSTRSISIAVLDTPLDTSGSDTPGV